jgi:hypothetical protein
MLRDMLAFLSWSGLTEKQLQRLRVCHEVRPAWRLQVPLKPVHDQQDRTDCNDQREP